MKKLVFAAVAMLTAIAANAASITWTATAAGTVLPDSSAASGVVAYLFEGSLSDTVLKDIAAGTWDAANSGYLYTKNANATGAISQTKIGSYENETVSFSMVLFDAATYETSQNFKYAEVNDVVFTTANKTVAFATPLQAASWQAVAVPEPTSGLLLLLGMAGLALKRKRA